MQDTKNIFRPKAGKTAIIDLDWCKYTAANAGETRTILVKHKKSGKTKEFSTRTDFYGSWQKKDGGWLGEQNKIREQEGKPKFSVEDFEITDVQVAESLQNILHTAKMMVDGALAKLGTRNYKAFLGEGQSWRTERSTIIKYKDRDHLLKPLMLEEVVDYLKEKYKPEVVTGIEADDAVVMEAYRKPNLVVVGEDKDHYAQPVNYFNVNRTDEGIINCDCFGKLWLDAKGKVRGYGRLFLYFQIASGDATDCYFANSASDVRWGEKSAYKALLGAENDTHAWRKLVAIYKKLYPEPKVIKGWRGTEFEIDWLYVLQENFEMARMLRFEGDHVMVKDVLDKLGIDYAVV